MRNGIAVAALLVIVGLAAGCGSSESAKEDSTAATTTIETAAPSGASRQAPHGRLRAITVLYRTQQNLTPAIGEISCCQQ
jgi:hypothetical protein